MRTARTVPENNGPARPYKRSHRRSCPREASETTDAWSDDVESCCTYRQSASAPITHRDGGMELRSPDRAKCQDQRDQRSTSGNRVGQRARGILPFDNRSVASLQTASSTACSMSASASGIGTYEQMTAPDRLQRHVACSRRIPKLPLARWGKRGPARKTFAPASVWRIYGGGQDIQRRLFPACRQRRR
jgi:hypothetical protein